MKEDLRKKKIEQKSKEINLKKGTINFNNIKKSVNLPNIRSSSSLLINHHHNETNDKDIFKKSTNHTTDIIRSKSVLHFNNVNNISSNEQNQYKNLNTLKPKCSNNSDSPTASFLSPERRELFPIKDKDNRNEQRYVGIPNYSLVQQSHVRKIDMAKYTHRNQHTNNNKGNRGPQD